MLTFPDNDPKMPIKFNLLWLIVNNGPMDIDGLYTALVQIRNALRTLKQRLGAYQKRTSNQSRKHSLQPFYRRYLVILKRNLRS